MAMKKKTQRDELVLAKGRTAVSGWAGRGPSLYAPNVCSGNTHHSGFRAVWDPRWASTTACQRAQEVVWSGRASQKKENLGWALGERTAPGQMEEAFSPREQGKR